MQKKEYKTRGKERLLSFLKGNSDRQYTADEIYDSLSDECAVGKSSLYRQLSHLCNEGVIRKFRSGEADAFVYQYMDKDHGCEDHFHLKCLSCGKVLHLECGVTEEMREHIQGEHAFKIDSSRSLLYGECAECSLKSNPQ